MARMLTVPLSQLGGRGLNTQEKDLIIDPSWATVLTNAVYGDRGALTARRGYQYLHASSLAEEVIQVHTYVDNTGSTLLLFSTPTKLYKIVGSTVTDITGTATTPTAGNWKFQNFNGKCVGWQTGHTPIVLDDVSDTWADLTGTAIPSGNEVLSAFGRLWVVDGDEVKYSDLLIYNDFSGGTAGSADLTIYWPQQDEAVGLAEHNGFIFVFGKNNIVILSSPEDPSNLAIEDSIQQVGLIGRDAKTPTPTDYAFASRLGITTLGRVIQEKSLPVRPAMPQLRDQLSADLLSVTADAIHMTFSQDDNSAYMTTGAKMYVLDLKSTELGARALQWSFVPNTVHEFNGVVYYGVTNYLAKREGYTDGQTSAGVAGSSYNFNYEGPWTDLGRGNIKILKGAGFRMAGAGSQVGTFKWYLGFSDSVLSRQFEIPLSGRSEWGVFEFGVGTWSGGVNPNPIKVGMSGANRIIKWGFSVPIDGEEFSVLSLSLRMKLGKEEI